MIKNIKVVKVNCNNTSLKTELIARIALAYEYSKTEYRLKFANGFVTTVLKTFVNQVFYETARVTNVNF